MTARDEVRFHVRACVGIDLGTTFSVVAHLDAVGRPASVPNTDGELTTPSVMFLDPAGAVFGKEAVKAVEFDPDRAAALPKRERNTLLPASADARFPMLRDGQRSVMGSVIEGGDATGKHAGPVGKCLVQNLPPGLPKSTVVDVSFAYTDQGRLEVRAAIPAVNQVMETAIERAVGVPELQLAAWSDAV